MKNLPNVVASLRKIASDPVATANERLQFGLDRVSGLVPDSVRRANIIMIAQSQAGKAYLKGERSYVPYPRKHFSVIESILGGALVAKEYDLFERAYMLYLRWNEDVNTASDVTATVRTVANLPLGPGEKDAKGTQSLQNMKKLKATPDGTLSSGITSAGYYAKKMNKTMYTYVGNSYGHTVWHVTEKTSECLNPINNTGTKLVSVTPDLVMSWHTVRPERDL